MLLRPPKTVKFDPANKSHRASVREFMKRRAWGDSPIRFTYDPVYGSVVEQVQTKLLAWYLEKEVTHRTVKPAVAVVAIPKISLVKKKA